MNIVEITPKLIVLKTRMTCHYNITIKDFILYLIYVYCIYYMQR